MVSPGLVAQVRRAFHPSGAKDDPTDAAPILDILEKHPEQLRRIDPDDPRTRQVVTLVEARRDLVGQRVRITNQLTANLKDYHPQALECFDDIASTMAGHKDGVKRRGPHTHKRHTQINKTTTKEGVTI